jgi:hypothetical protein
LLLRNEYLAAENRVLRGQLKGRLKLSDGERATRGEIGQRLGRQALGEVATSTVLVSFSGSFGSGLNEFAGIYQIDLRKCTDSVLSRLAV